MERGESLERMAREFSARLSECEHMRDRYLKALDGPTVSVEEAGSMWRALSIATRRLAEDYPVTLLGRMR